MLSSCTSHSSGAPFASKSGISSRSADGSSSAPDSWCAPASRAFSITAIDSGSPPSAFCSCASRSAADSPAGPAADDQDIDFERLASQRCMRSSVSPSFRARRSAPGAISKMSPWMP